MDLSAREYFQAPSMAENRGRALNVSTQRRSDVSVNSVNVQRRLTEAPPTPGRPIFSFSVANLARKTVPSKWDDAEKWLISSSCSDSPAQRKLSKNVRYQMEQESSFIQEKVPQVLSTFQLSDSLDHHDPNRAFNGGPGTVDVFLKDKFTDEVEVEPNLPNFRCTEPSKEGFIFRNSASETMEDENSEVTHRDKGTEMSPLGSSTTSRCHSPFKNSSPPRHNTPATRSGLLASGDSSGPNNTIDIFQLQDCHLAKLQLETNYGTAIAANWSSREEEEEEVSKSLRHFETDQLRVASAWEEQEKSKCCLRYQREEAKIQAWVNLQIAKSEAQSRKLEVKIQKMRSNLEEKLMKKMTTVHRKAEELRAVARQQHAQPMQNSSGQAQKMINRHIFRHSHSSCGCFPSNNSH